MTAPQKKIISQFLNLARGYNDSGYAGDEEGVFEDDPASGDEPGGLPLAYLMEEEDLPGKPLALITGAALAPEEEQLLDKVLGSAGLYRDKNCVFVDQEDSLEKQIRWFMPKVILYLGRDTSNIALPGNIPVLTTCRPADILRDDSLKRPAFEDMKQLMLELAGLDRHYAEENRELLRKYASADKNFASRVEGLFA